MAKANLIGQRFGRLVVTKEVGRDKHSSILWEAICDCGNITISTTTQLRGNNKKQSCGCLRLERLRDATVLPEGGAALTNKFNAYKQRAKVDGYSFTIEKEDFARLTKERCHYCGSKPAQVSKSKGPGQNYVYNGLDRIDNSVGYELNNVVACCKVCNRAKNSMPYSEYIDHILKSAEFIRSTYGRI